MERIRWPDGPVCPYCGARESIEPADDGTLLYECRSCGAHRGHIRSERPEPGSRYEVPRRRIVPRFPG